MVASALLDTSYTYGIQRLATQMRMGLMKLLFTKARKISNKERSERGIGAIVSHLQMDTRILSQGVVYVNMLWGIPFQLLICLYLLYQQLGMAAFAGAGVSLVIAPLIFAAARLQRLFRRHVMRCRDTRVKFLTEILQGAKTIKLFAWESKVRDEIGLKRKEEVSAIFRTQMMGAIAQFLTLSLPSLVCIASFATFTALRGSGALTPERAFTSLALLGLLSSALGQIPSVLTSLIGMQVSGERIESFLRAEEYHEFLIESLSDIHKLTQNHDVTEKTVDRKENKHDNNDEDHDDLLIMKSEFTLEEEEYNNNNIYGEYSNLKSKHNNIDINKYGSYYRYVGNNKDLMTLTCQLSGDCHQLNNNNLLEIDENDDIIISIKNASFEWSYSSSISQETDPKKKNKKNKKKNKKMHSNKTEDHLSSSPLHSSSKPSFSLLQNGGDKEEDEEEGGRGNMKLLTHRSDHSNYVLKSININIKKGQIVGLIGSVGSGKSSLLYAILNELPSSNKQQNINSSHDRNKDIYNNNNNNNNNIDNIDIKVGLQNSSQSQPSPSVSCCGKVAFCSQEPWILNQTLRENILFGDEYDEVRYQQVIEACALQTDIESLLDGDNTEIGERGLNLSGGQKARVALARAVYSNADVYLLDDILAAVDRQTSTHLLNALFLPPSGLLSGCVKGWPRRTVILATNQTDWLPQAHQIIILSNNSVMSSGTYEELLQRGIDPLILFSSDQNENIQQNNKSSSHNETIGKGKSKGKGKGKGGGKGGKGISVSEEELQNTPTFSAVKKLTSVDASFGTKVNHPNKEIGITLSINKEQESGTEGGGSVSVGSIVDGLIGSEQRVRGALNNRIWFGYVKALGYRGCFLVLVLYGCSEGLRTTGDYVLAKWTSSSDNNNDNDNDNNNNESNNQNGDFYSFNHYMYVGRSRRLNDGFIGLDSNQDIIGLNFHLFFYASLLLLACFIVLLRAVALVFANVRACSKVHDAALWAVLRSPMDFFDTTTSGRVLNRFSSDQQLVDIQLRNQMASLLNSALQMTAGLVVVIASTPFVILVLLPLCYFYYGIQLKYRTSAREVQRLLSISRSPIFQKTSELVSGLSTVRAFRKGEKLEKKFVVLVNRLARTIRTANTLRRWLALRLEVFGAFVVLAVALSAVITEVVTNKPANAALVGLSLSYALKVTGYLNGFLTSLSDAELGLVSLERLQQFANLPPEPPLSFPTDKSNIKPPSGSGFHHHSNNGGDGGSSDSLIEPLLLPHHHVPSSILPTHDNSSSSAPLTSTLTMNDSTMNPMKAFHQNQTTSKSTITNQEEEEELVKSYIGMTDPPMPWPVRGHIIFENVSMSYRLGLPNVLNQLSFQVQPGEKIGIVGRTGSGKSSILVSLFRLPMNGLNHGRILIDGVDIASVGMHTLRSNMMIIPQDPVLFSGTLRGNLDPFKEHEDSALLDALHSVGLLQFLLERQRIQQEQYNNEHHHQDLDSNDLKDNKTRQLSSHLHSDLMHQTPSLSFHHQNEECDNISLSSHIGRNSVGVSGRGTGRGRDRGSDGGGGGGSTSSIDVSESGESDIRDSEVRGSSVYYGAIDALSLPIDAYGENLSVGQRQLLCIARGLLKNCKVCVLDEATAAIDKATDDQIQRTLSRCLQDATVLTIAHRIETVMKSDKIMVMENGHSIEFDSPTNLLSNSESNFSKLWKGSIAKEEEEEEH
eukprot:CAMPEP_0114389062 /NCGR_PEP_ID=MMETSP0102-20121206/8404_1 /TAXON_ID=38822 ORGANISM="Pteridomonas danica, Strain PT" /NCGR_SAMPLE_ID=MMETSP0102 /ASSEMBLY_ACC=CAM_ASM_000212 /LENGTH=1694 /DNA_ID=CAMNT_0001546829 /DNA_START=606 /DNA_END=5690 /DNA_ORIENTATION=+